MLALTIANMLISYPHTHLYLTNMKINKLVYFAQVECLRIHRHRLFDEPIQAWECGPVAPSVYAAFKEYGPNRITAPAIIDEHDQTDSSVGLQAVRNVVQRVAALYGPLAAFELVDYLHRDGSAWKAVYESGKNKEITEEAMLRSHDGIDHPDLRRTLAGGVRAVDERFPNVLKLLEAS